MTQRRSNFSGKVMKDAQRQSAGANFGHLILPRGMSVFTPEPGGRYLLDFIPYVVTDTKHPDRDNDSEIAVPDSLWYKRPYSIHRNIGANKDMVICLKSVGKKCPICEYRDKRKAEGAEKKELDDLRPSKRNLYIVVPLKNKEFEQVPHLFDFSSFNFQDLLINELKEKEENGIFPDLRKGKSVRVRFESKTIGTGQPFPVANRIDFEDREEQYDDSFVDDLPSLDKCIRIFTYEQLEAMFFETDVEEDGGTLHDVDPLEKNVLKFHKEENEDEPVRKPKCPSGYRFGLDTNVYDECQDCEVWQACKKAKNAR